MYCLNSIWHSQQGNDTFKYTCKYEARIILVYGYTHIYIEIKRLFDYKKKCFVDWIN